ncbi:MAG: SMI1/KNR4 family protein [Polyangiaceae bacterium]
MTSERLQRAWQRIERGVAAFDVPRARLADGAGEPELAALEQAAGFTLPQEAKALWSAHDGQISAELGLAAGFHFVSVSEAGKILRDWRDVRTRLGVGLTDLDRVCSSHPRDAIQQRYSLPGWIPLLRDDEGNCVGVDLEPGPSGKRGQVINFGRDEEEKHVLFDDTCELLEWLADEYDAARIVFDRGDGVVRHVAGRLTSVAAARTPRTR